MALRWISFSAASVLAFGLSGCAAVANAEGSSAPIFGMPVAILTGSSGLSIPAGQEFLLGGNQKGILYVRAENQTEHPIPIYTIDPDGSRALIAEAVQGNPADYAARAGETVVLVNPSDTKTARLFVRFNGSPQNYGMRYEGRVD